MLDLRRVRVFYEVAERRSFSEAAAALDYTQPSVSHHVSMLERELGQRLINRGTRPLTLTEAGETLHAAAAVALAEFSRAERRLQALKEGESGRVALASVVSGLRTIVPRAVLSFRRRFPNVELALEEAQPSDVLARLRSGELDVGIVVLREGGEPPERATFVSHLLVEQPLVLAVGARHRLAGRSSVSLGTVRGERWLLPSPARFPEFRLEVERLLAAAGVTAVGTLDFTDDIAAAGLIAAGVGVGIVPGIPKPADMAVSLIGLRPAVTRRLLAVTVRGACATPVAAMLDELRRAAGARASAPGRG